MTTMKYALVKMLQLEDTINVATSNRISSPLTLLMVLLVLLNILTYHAIMIMSFEEIVEAGENAGAVLFAMICNLVTILALFSSIWCTPLTVLLGRDGSIHQKGEDLLHETPKQLLRQVARASLHTDDFTSRALFIGNIIACFTNQFGETMFFITGFTPDGDIEKPPIFASIVYFASSMTCTTVLTLGSAYVALANNVFSVQLESFARAVNGVSIRHGESEKHKNHVGQLAEDSLTHDGASAGVELSESFRTPTSDTDKEDEDTSSLLGRTINPEEPSKKIFRPRDISVIYLELRRRHDIMSAKWHRLIGFAVLSLFAETTIMVVQGYGDRVQKFSRTQVIGILCTFIGNSFALWSIVFSIGRILHVSREELGFAVRKWALRSPDLDFSRAGAIAQMISDFPFRFYIGIFEINQDVARGITLLLLGLALIFVGVHLPQL